jgi:DNA-binding CsgD family transcriptional regulator
LALKRSIQPWPPAVDTPSSAHVLEGPAGIGKSHRFAELIAEAGDVRIMRAQPSQAETRLVGSALIDLCSEVSDDEIAALPEVQANALMTALMRGSRPVGNPDAIGVAFSGLVRSLASQGPIAIAIDDVHWIDQQTADVLIFAARRFPATGVGVLLASRTEPQVDVRQAVTDLCAALPSEREQLTGLSSTAIEQVLRERLGSGLPRADLTTAVDLAAGNPLFAVEIARSSLSARQDGAARTNHTLPESLYDAIGRHVAALAAPAREALAAAAALAKPQLHQLRSLGVDLDLAPAEEAGLIRIVHGAIVFTHPLYATAAYDQLSAGARARLHRRLADVVESREEQARHLALGAAEPDESVAAALDAASKRAMDRGAPSAAIDAASLALTATPSDSTGRVTRLLWVGELLFRTGATDRAIAELQTAVNCASTDRDRAHALHILAKSTSNAGDVYEGHQLAKQALELVGDDLGLKAKVLVNLAWTSMDDFDAGLQYAIQAREVLEELPDADPAVLADAMTNEAGARFYTGTGCDIETLRRAVDMQAGDTTLQILDRAICVLGYVLLWYDDYPGAREVFGAARQMSIDEGDDHSLIYILRHLATLEIRAGRWNDAELLIEEYEGLAERCDLAVYSRRAALDRARIALNQGDTTAAIGIGKDHIERGIASEQLQIKQLGHGLCGAAALVDGDPHHAAIELDQWHQVFLINNAAEPALREHAGDHIEALVLAGRDVDAEKAIEQLVELAEPLGRTVMLAAAARGRALLLAERGEIAQALESAEDALALYRRIERPFETARTHLVKGQIHRRLRQKALARRELDVALAIFTQLGAAGFAERTQREVERIGGRTAAPLELTETERRVAESAASGMTTAEIATSLFISTHTVSANLTRVFRKLNVRNRTELAARLESGTTVAG